MWKDFLRDEGGASSIEYAMVASLVGVAIVTALLAASTDVEALYLAIAEGFEG